ncbi:transcriptional regulator [Paenibacillus tyrfis]|uniref:helix-turn-helix domain-containing protein n=1 Tax=Paenibacillus TaxID=44249 RepID=UPI0024936EC5|nr:helix-turn-helix transcriptional regulator [Paenibacillus tyrfis]GLI06374.1 transcriptional regulator [Paenibacillus tyrfis]GMX63509.1 helix-turn-helix domain-containing protein [Paenibacillus elgii]
MIGKRIQHYRKQKRISLTELANRAGVAKSYLSSIERNIQKNPSIEFLHKISAVLGVEVEALIHDVPPYGYQLSLNDLEWLQFAREANSAGISIHDVRHYVEKCKLIEQTDEEMNDTACKQ